MRLPRWRRVLSALLLTSSLVIVIKQLRHHDVIEVTEEVKADDMGQWVNMTGIPLASAAGSLSTEPCNLSEWPCDSECLRFRQRLNEFPPGKQRAFIYYLAQKKTIHKLNISLHYLDANFNDRFDYPVVVFVEPELNNVEGRQTIRSFTSTPRRLFIQVVHFRLPPFITSAVPRRAGNGKPIGYRHMCRFHAITVYRHPIMMSDVQYAWRLDDDSFLYRALSYDPFAFMRDRRLLYGYIQIRDEAPYLIRGLWETADEYIRAAGGDPPEFYSAWKRTKMYYTNFEISSVSLWMSPEYCRLADHIDRRGGIYYRRWGDAPIKTIAVTLLVARNQTHHFADIAYKHNIYHNRGRAEPP